MRIGCLTCLHSQMLGSTSMQGVRSVGCYRTRSVSVSASFSFADSKRVKPPQQGRRNRTLEKREESELRTLVHGLCKMNNKQLQAVSHLLQEEHIEQIKIAMNIPPTNQGRRRQEALVMKLLRADQDLVNIDKIAQAVTAAERNNLTYTDTDVEHQLQYWIDGLISNDQEVVDEVYQVLQQHNLDWQQLRTWVRQVQQRHQQQQQQQAHEQQQHMPHDSKAESSNNNSSSTTVSQDSDSSRNPTYSQRDEELQQLMLELAEQQQRQQRSKGKGSKGQGGGSSMTNVRRSIRRLLKPLAVEICS